MEGDQFGGGLDSFLLRGCGGCHRFHIARDDLFDMGVEGCGLPASGQGEELSLDRPRDPDEHLCQRLFLGVGELHGAFLRPSLRQASDDGVRDQAARPGAGQDQGSGVPDRGAAGVMFGDSLDHLDMPGVLPGRRRRVRHGLEKMNVMPGGGAGRRVGDPAVAGVGRQADSRGDGLGRVF